MNRGIIAQMAFLLAVVLLLVTAVLLRTGTHETSTLDGLYLPMFVLVGTFVVLYLDSQISLGSYVANAILFSVVLNSLPLIKYRFLNGADVNYFYRILVMVSSGSSLNSIQEIPSLTGIYDNFPGFVGLNVIFIKVTGLGVLDAYKVLFPIVYGILYVTSFYLLSGLLSHSLKLRRAVVLASTIPYALLPAQVWNYYMMPVVFGSLLLLFVLWIALQPPGASSRRLQYTLMLVVFLATIAVTHPLVSLYAAILLTGLLLLKFFGNRRHTQTSDFLTPSIVILSWGAMIGWQLYSTGPVPFVREAVELTLAFIIAGFRLPPVTERLQSAGPLTFLITHIGKIGLAILALPGLWGILRRKSLEIRTDFWIISTSILISVLGLVLLTPSYAFVDIYVGYRSLFLFIVVLTLAAGVGLFRLTKDVVLAKSNRWKHMGRSMGTGILLCLILTASLTELYPTEYINPTVSNSVHTIYEKNAVIFLSRYWTGEGQVFMATHINQVAQSFGSPDLIDVIIIPSQLEYTTLRDPLTTLIDAQNQVARRSNVIYNSGFIIANSTLR